MNAWRHQLPTYSPLSLRATLEAVRAAVPVGTDPRLRIAEILRREYRANDLILSDSGTNALQLAIGLAWRVLGEKTTVAVPAFSCFDVGSAAVGVDARIAPYDLDPITLAPDLDSLRAAMTSGARVVIVAPLYGVPVDWDAVVRCAEDPGAVVIEDAAQGIGASWRGRPLGTLGRLSVLSFGRGKGWSGIRGGALLVRSLEIPPDTKPTLPEAKPTAEAQVALAAVAQWTLGRPSLYGLPASLPWLGLGETRYKEPTAPQGMSRAGARLLECTQQAARQEAGWRQEQAKTWEQTIPYGPHIRPIELPLNAEAGFLRFPLLLSHGIAGFGRPRDARRLGMAPSYPKPLGALPPVAARMRAPDRRCPGAQELVETLVTLPTHSLLTAAERARLLQLLAGYRR
jgi:hypothetical protein